MRHHTSNGLSWYTFDALDDCPLRHGIFTRRGGRSAVPFTSLNVGHSVGDERAAVDANQGLVLSTLGVSPQLVVTGRQVHGHRVAAVGPAEAGRVIPATDGLVTDVPSLTLLLRFADCVPIFLYDPTQRAAGLGHAGWRGTIGRLAEELLTTLSRAYGTRAENVVAGLGPGIGPCCYRIGSEVVDQVTIGIPEAAQALSERGGAIYFDLWEANRAQLAGLGVRHIEVSELCTADHVDDFFSYRAEGGHTGRFAALISVEPSA